MLSELKSAENIAEFVFIQVGVQQRLIRVNIYAE